MSGGTGHMKLKAFERTQSQTYVAMFSDYYFWTMLLYLVTVLRCTKRCESSVKTFDTHDSFAMTRHDKSYIRTLRTAYCVQLCTVVHCYNVHVFRIVPCECEWGFYTLRSTM